MVDGVNQFKFGKLSGEFLKNLKTGLKETDLKTEKEIKLFKAIDADKNGVIDKSEIDKLYDALDTSNDGEISKKEAKAFLKENGLEDLKKKDLKNFLNKYVENTEDVADAEVVEGKVQITYKNGTQEIVNSDRSKELINKDAQGNTVKKEVTEDYKLKQETVTAQNGDTKATKYAEDGKTIQQTVEKEVNTNTTTTVSYENGKKSSKKVEKGTTEENYKYEDETEVLDSKIENKGIPAKEKHSKYTYNADRSVTETITEPAANRTTVRTKSETGVVEDITDDSGKTHNVYNANNKKLSQTKEVNGKEYSIQYDGAGNTSVIVQNGESVADLAKKFGVTEEEIKNANKELLDKNKKFSVGDEVKIPKEIEADEKALQGRKSSEGAKADYELQKKKEAQAALRRQQAAAQAAAKKAQAAAQEAQYKAAGLINHKGQGTKVTGHYKSGKQETFTVIGEAGNGRKLAKDKNGKLVTVAHDGVILKESYVQASNLYSKGKKIQGKIKDKTGKLVTKEFVEIPGMGKLPHGRKAVVDAKGRTFIMAQDGVVLSDEYIAKSNAADVIRKDSKVAQAQTLDMLESQLSSAKAAFNEQMKQDGWAGDLADGVSVLWGSDNRASKVREDFAKYSNTIKELKAAAQKGDAIFEAKFQEKFGVKYNKSAVADYLMRPTAANYRKAFGTKQSIGERVAKYNESQQAGAGWVKAGVEMAATSAVTGVALAGTVLSGGLATPVAMGVVAGTTFITDTVVEGSDRMKITGEYRDADGNIVKDDGTFRDGTDWGDIVKDSATDAAIAGVTLGLGKYATAAYKGAKTTYKAYKVANTVGKATINEGKIAKAAAVEVKNAAIKNANKVAVSKTEDAVINTISDVSVGAAAEYIQTGDVSVSGTLTNAVIGSAGIVGEKIGGKLKAKFHRSKNEVGATNTAESQGVMHATGDAAHHSGGKLNAEKMENARTEVRDIAQNGTPKEVAKAHQAADYQQVQSRAQGRELKQNIEDASGFVSVGKERIALDSSSLDDLAKAKKAVEGWSNGTRDKEAILAKIDTRMNEIKAGQVKPTEPARASEIVDEINTNVNKASENIMEGKTGAIGSHDAATLRDNLVNNVKTEEDVEKFIADIKNRVGVDDKGNMHVYQVQGKDHAADLVNQAETKLKSIRANKADMQQITTTLDDAISSNKGLSEDSLKSIRAFSAKSNSVEDLQNIIDKMKNNNIKKSSAQKKLIRDMQDKVDILKAKQSATNVVTAEPEKAQVADDGKTADFTTEQQRIYQEEMQAVKEAPAPAQKPQETAPQPVEVKPENNVQNNTNKINNNNEAVQKSAVEKVQNNTVENKPAQSTSEKPVSGQKMDSVKSTQTTKAHIKQVIKDLPDNMKQSFVSIYNEISNLTSMVNVAAIRNKISTKFSKYAEALNSLTDRLEAKISSLKNSLKTTSNTSSSSIKVVTTEKEANSVYQKMVNDRAVNWDDSKKSLSVMKDGKPYFIDVQGWRYEIHESSGTGNFITDYNKMNKQINTPWKMHIYADSPQEWANAAQVAMPYLQENKIMYKTMSEISEDEFNAIRNATNSEGFHSQTGKAFTVYFRSEDEFLQAAKDLETRFKQSGLKSSGTVANEHQVGDSGFLSYRHEGAERGTTYKPDNVEDPYLKMLNNEKTTTPKSNNHVVESEAENLFNDSINMNEKNVVSGQSVNKPVTSNQTNRAQNSNKVSQSVSQFNVGDKLPKGQEFAIKGNEVFRIGNSTIDLSSPEIKNRMKQMKDGQTLTIGRDGDIQIWADDTVSRKHLEITKTRDGFVVRDISSNGTFVSGTKSVNQTREVRFETSTYNRQGQVKASGVSYNNPRLNKYKINKNTPVKNHERFYQDNKELFAGTRTWKGTIWQGYTPADQHHGAWKMHMYSIDEHDWQQMSEALIPYLKDNGIEWKTFNAGSTGVHELNGSSQEGKAFTIYPRDNAHMEQIARDLDYIIKNNGLNINGSNIVGDRAMGDNGRLFYRYEYNTGAVKDINLDLSNRDDFAMYDSLYDGNDDRIKRNGKANYLADDMTPADDPWFNFNPSDPNSYPDISEYVENLFSA